MIVVVSVSLLAILLTYLDSCGKVSNGMFLGFLFITIIGCIHYNYGNDYMGYLDMYYEITRIPLRFDYLVEDVYGRDPGWVVINHIFKPFGGFFTMVAVLNIFQNIIYYKFIKDNVAKKYWAFAILIYLMSGSLYIVNFSMMRQGLTISLFIFSWSFMKKKKILPALLILIIASTIHHSAKMIIPFALFPIIPIKNRVLSITYVILIIVLFVSSKLLSDIFYTLSTVEELQGNQSMDYYSKADDADDLSSIGIGFFINLLPLLAAIWVLNQKKYFLMDESHKMLIAISLVSYVIMPFGQVISIIGRFGMYFDAFKIAAIPFVYSLLPRKWNQILSSIYIFMLIYGYYSFFVSPVWMKNYSTFHTIFSLLI